MSEETEKRQVPEEGDPARDGMAKEESGLKVNLFYWLQALVVALVALTVVFTFFGRIVVVVGQSMEPTLSNGELLIIQSVEYEPRQGDIVVLNKYTSSVLDGDAIVKRCIATEGQTVEIDYVTGTVTVDGVVLDEPYIKEAMRDPGLVNSNMTITSVTVPEGSIFVLGDNRNNSTDSRHVQVGTIDERYVLGKAVLVLFPLDRIGPI